MMGARIDGLMQVVAFVVSVIAVIAYLFGLIIGFRP
jgi:hypothetical protein